MQHTDLLDKPRRLPRHMPNQRKRVEAMDVIVTMFLSLFMLMIVLPFYYTLILSLSSRATIANIKVLLWPRQIHFGNYLLLLRTRVLYTGYLSTLMITGGGVVYGMTITVLSAYAISRPAFPLKRFFFILLLVPMFFGGGLVPAYFNLRDLGLLNSRLGIILMGGVSSFYIVIIKNSIEQIPESLTEAAKIDGANEMSIFWNVVIPLQMPMIATFTLFIAVDYWNSWFWPMMILNDLNKFPLPLVLRSIVQSTASNYYDGPAMLFNNFEISTVGTQMATLLLTILPIMAVYPFLQKHFVKGVLVGAIKM